MLSQGDTPICQIWFAYVKEQRRSCPADTNSLTQDVIDPCIQKYYDNVKANIIYMSDTKTCQKHYKFDLNFNGKHCIGNKNVKMVIHPCAKYSKPM